MHLTRTAAAKLDDGLAGASGHPVAGPTTASSATVSAEESAVLDEVSRRVRPRLDEISGRGRVRGLDDPVIRVVYERLTPEQLDESLRLRVGLLVAVLSSAVDSDELASRGRDSGYSFAMMGLPVESYVEASNAFVEELLALVEEVGGGPDLGAARDLVTRRSALALRAAVRAFTEVGDDVTEVLTEVLDVAGRARTVSDLARGVVGALGRMDGVNVVMFARLTTTGQMEYEFGGGPQFDEFLRGALHAGYAPVTVDATSATGQGPVGRAWRHGQTEISHALLKDPTTRPWHPMFLTLGWNASAAVPLVRGDRTRALLSLNARYVGFFFSPQRAALLQQVKVVVEGALGRLQQLPGLSSQVRPMVDRAEHVARLRAGDVVMQYQPLISILPGRLTRVEALARLVGPQGLVAPAQFLPAFGDDELFSLFSLGLHQALGAVTRWQDEGLSTGVSVNLPVVATDDERYLACVQEALERHDVEPGRLTLELLEAEFGEGDIGTRCRSLERMSALGVRLSQDDLGSGHSSLLRLRHLPFDEVKIDQSFLLGAEQRPGSSFHVVKLIGDMARNLGLDVVIEGLEDVGLVDAAVQLGVREGQGYAIAHPMPADSLIDWEASYSLHIDPERPVTRPGALAAHVAWDQRRAAGVVGSGSGLADCLATGFLDDRAEVERHEVVHRALEHSPGGDAHRLAWQWLATRLAG